MDGMNMIATATATAMATTASMGTGMSMGNHTMGGMGDMGDMDAMFQCKMDVRFLAKSWHITSRGMFAGSCIGVICLVICLDFLRRVGREYDAYIVRQARLRQSARVTDIATTCDDNACPGTEGEFSTPKTLNHATAVASGAFVAPGPVSYRPSLAEHTIRSLIHMVQFAVAYIVMLLAMYYNGYIIICIFIGAFLGAFIFAWEPVSLAKE
ncbi:Ctr copper transporter family protein [Penicillium brevicompactum]|uniref:Ctr copper transporter family protein n=1 Tax=Penicillium brevicompactum TaxID=5074 RepID=UPI0025422358|nr:Ctr copper transporter family protein [Penicillium brevicompactum]KAJ5327540.1 Ctr copper transporter family protein [Penicillium brevicompactum]